jgi:hypothetical protein
MNNVSSGREEYYIHLHLIEGRGQKGKHPFFSVLLGWQLMPFSKGGAFMT